MRGADQYRSEKGYCFYWRMGWRRLKFNSGVRGVKSPMLLSYGNSKANKLAWFVELEIQIVLSFL